MRVLLVSTYELGHQPLHVAAAAGALRTAGHDVRALDLSVEPFDREAAEWADAVAFSVPMHTAMRLAVESATRLRGLWPDLPICFYGLYAVVGRDRIVGRVADHVIAGEYRDRLVAWAASLERGVACDGAVIDTGRHAPALPARDLLPPLERYAHLATGSEHRLVGYVEASTGCRHRCRHCPVPTIYDGIFRIASPDAVLADVSQLVASGARHITFGDPDFFNGPHHARRVVDAVHVAFPDLTFDVTVKVEHILGNPDVWPWLADRGLLFVVSAFETTNDPVLAALDKGHTAADASAAVDLLRASGVEIRPSFLPFTPWSRLADAADICMFLADHDLFGNVDPVQLTIRLLVPDGSLLLASPDMEPHLREYEPELLGYRWQARDLEVDALQSRLAKIVAAGVDAGETNECMLETLASEVAATTGLQMPQIPAGAVAGRPRLTEPWFC